METRPTPERGADRPSEPAPAQGELETPAEGGASRDRERRGRGARATGPLPRLRRPVFYSIGDVCKMVGLKPHVLRYWETQFKELAPAKNTKGNRVYRARDLEIISLIHRLVHEERYTLEGARRRLEEMRAAGELESNSQRALEASFLGSLRAELEKLDSLLEPPS